MDSVENIPRPAQASSSLWWMHPFWVMAVPLMVLSLIAYLLPEPEYRDAWRTGKTFAASDLLLCFAVAGVFSAGCLLAAWFDAGFSNTRRLAPGPRDAAAGRHGLRILFGIAFILTIGGYAVWYSSILRQGGIGMFKNLLLGGDGAPDVLKQSAKDSMIKGVTTFTQFGMGTAVLGAYLGFTQGWDKVRTRLLLLFALTAVRAIFLSERLSLIEVVLPSLIVLIRLIGFGRPGSVLRRFLLVAPLVGIGGLYTLFTFTEYFRSWSGFYSEHGERSLFTFTSLRLLGYYVTALNNGAIEWHEHGAVYFPYSTMGWLWNFPGVGKPLEIALGGTHPPGEVRDALLSANGNPELNNPSGIFVVFIDLGIPGALLYFAFYGCIAGLFYASYRRGSMAGLLLYAFLFTALTEQCRTIYVSTGRSFPTWVLLFLGVLVSRPSRRRGIALPVRAAPPSASPSHFGKKSGEAD
jgi:oligosaccharide repeat unit polymerase